MSEIVQNVRNSKRNKVGSLSVGVYNLAGKCSIKTATIHHSSVNSMAGGGTYRIWAAGKEGRQGDI